MKLIPAEFAFTIRDWCVRTCLVCGATLLRFLPSDDLMSRFEFHAEFYDFRSIFSNKISLDGDFNAISAAECSRIDESKGNLELREVRCFQTLCKIAGEKSTH